MQAHWFGLVLGVLATWRVAHMLAHEDGPWDLVLRLRQAVGDGPFGRVLDCLYCLSLWIAAPIAFTVADDPIGWVIAWLALSGAACLLDRLVTIPTAAIQPLAIEGDPNELLRTQPGITDVQSDAAQPGANTAGTRQHEHIG